MAREQTQNGQAQAADQRSIWIIFSGLMLALLISSLDQTVVATALPTIVSDLGGLSQLSWVVTGYLLTSTVSTPLWGKLGDLYGRKRFFQTTIVLFLVGSALCGLSQNMAELILFRTLQGLGGGGLIVLVQAIIGDIVPPRDRGRYQGSLERSSASPAWPDPCWAAFLSTPSPGAGSSTSICPLASSPCS